MANVSSQLYFFNKLIFKMNKIFFLGLCIVLLSCASPMSIRENNLIENYFKKWEQKSSNVSGMENIIPMQREFNKETLNFMGNLLIKEISQKEKEHTFSIFKIKHELINQYFFQKMDSEITYMK